MLIVDEIIASKIANESIFDVNKREEERIKQTIETIRGKKESGERRER